MQKIIINHSKPLRGETVINGSKNAVLPVMAASVLTSGTNIIRSVPKLEDVNIMKLLMDKVGITVEDRYNEISLNVGCIKDFKLPYELTSKMRASILLLAPMLSKLGRVSIAMPGGCNIGARPIDLHLKGLIAMGASIEQLNGNIIATAKKLYGAKIYLDFPSVGATENLIMAATLAEGDTILENVAVEPEIVDLVTFLSSAGAKIYGAGTDTIKITGVDKLEAVEHTVISDRIEAGTIMIAAAITGGDVLLKNVIPAHVKPITAKLKEAGVEVSEELSSIRVKAGDKVKSVDIKTLPYPGFPTDMQAQFATLLSRAEGNSIVVETIFENRFLYVPELIRMGASIKIDGRSAFIEGKKELNGAKVKATDLRAGASLILAGLASQGITEIDDIYHIDRGYDRIDEKLRELGANIERI